MGAGARGWVARFARARSRASERRQLACSLFFFVCCVALVLGCVCLGALEKRYCRSGFVTIVLLFGFMVVWSGFLKNFGLQLKIKSLEQTREQ